MSTFESGKTPLSDFTAQHAAEIFLYFASVIPGVLLLFIGDVFLIIGLVLIGIAHVLDWRMWQHRFLFAVFLFAMLITHFMRL